MQETLGRAYRLLSRPKRRERVRAYLNARKYPINRQLLADELSSEAPQVRSHPIYLYLDPATACNLRCPFCPTGNGASEIDKEILTRENFYKIVSNLKVHLLEKVCLYNWGEPFLNKHLTEFISYFSERGRPTTISTNFCVQEYDEAFLEKLVRSGLTDMDVSIDGASQETYGRYRIRGDFKRIIRNMKRLNEVKKSLGSETPLVRYKMLLNKINQHEVEKARRIAGECGAEFSLPEHFWCPEELRDEWVADSVREAYGDLAPTSISMTRTQTMHTECRQLWDTVLVGANGDVYPCCIVFKASQKVGNLTEQHIDTIRNNYMMRKMREYVCDPDAPQLDFNNHCDGCTNRYCTHDVRAEESSASPV